MSMVRCDECDRYVNSDDDPEVFVSTFSILCENCREDAIPTEGVTDHEEA